MTRTSRWTVRAEGSTIGMVADAAEVRAALKLFSDPENACELMALKSGAHRTLPGSDVDGLATAVAELPGGIGIYFRINPVPTIATKPANNADILRRRWIYIDVDPIKAEGQEDNPATDNEKATTGELCGKVNDYLAERNWPAPVVVDSGNGHGMFYPCDLANDKTTQAMLRRLLHELSERFSGQGGIIDKSVHNANRLAKLPGTWARKGVQSDDRPHRPCWILTVPSELVPVTFDLLAGAVGKEEPQPLNGKPKTYKADPLPGASAYARKALDSECNRVAFASPGERNNALNRAAFSLGQLVAGGTLNRSDVESRLADAAERCKLDDAEVGPTIRSGIEAGMKEPRGVPESKGPTPKFERKASEVKADADPNEPLTVKMSRIPRREVEWLVKNRIPKRFITVMAGRTGIGKSFVACDLIARLSNGGEIPFSDGQRFKAGGTLIISEDSHDYVLAPRLIDAGADLDRIHAMSWAAMGQYHLGDTDMLSKAVAEVDGGVSVVMIDPPTNFLEGTDEHKNSEVRQLVMRVVEWALDRDLAVLFILHVNKNAKGVEALNRVMGSVAWVTTSRVAHTFCPDPEDRDRGLWVPLKNNLGPMVKAIAYKIVQADGATRVEWCEEVDTNADDAMKNEAAPKKKRSVIAGVWLAGFFTADEKVAAGPIWKAMEDTTLSRNALLEAKEEMGILARYEHNDEGVRSWWWVWPKEAKTCWDIKTTPSDEIPP